jgi:hypothetical protein
MTASAQRTRRRLDAMLARIHARTRKVSARLLQKEIHEAIRAVRTRLARGVSPRL